MQARHSAILELHSPKKHASQVPGIKLMLVSALQLFMCCSLKSVLYFFSFLILLLAVPPLPPVMSSFLCCLSLAYKEARHKKSGGGVSGKIDFLISNISWKPNNPVIRHGQTFPARMVVVGDCRLSERT